MQTRIHKLLTGYHVDLGAIADVRSGADSIMRSDAEPNFAVRYVNRTEAVRFEFGWAKCARIVRQNPAYFPGLAQKLQGHGGREAQLEVLKIVEDDLIAAWKRYLDSGKVTADPIFLFDDTTTIDLSAVLEISRVTWVEELVLAFSVLYRGHSERRLFAYPIFNGTGAMAELLGLEFEEALADPHGDPEGVALRVISRNVERLVDAWREYKLSV